jgi:hypothetical protein
VVSASELAEVFTLTSGVVEWARYRPAKVRAVAEQAIRKAAQS